MDRKEFLHKAMGMGICSCTLAFLNGETHAASEKETTQEKINRLEGEKQFIQNWLIDLLDTIDKELDRDTQVKLLAGCGQGCFKRHSFKTDIAKKGQGNVDKLIEAYKQNFEIWQDGEQVHIRYGETSSHCYCPAANYRPAKPDDIHCECTRATHQAIWETAMGKPMNVTILESLRRGGKTCHFIVDLT
ncbi:MAG TPA: hypothetical protein PLP19_09865 [bacterium]|nr:hypothetical protein [bacterium]HPN43783.1 hypothetical protein [bacterium]